MEQEQLLEGNDSQADTPTERHRVELRRHEHERQVEERIGFFVVGGVKRASEYPDRESFTAAMLERERQQTAALRVAQAEHAKSGGRVKAMCIPGRPIRVVRYRAGSREDMRRREGMRRPVSCKRPRSRAPRTQAIRGPPSDADGEPDPHHHAGRGSHP